MFLAYVLYYPHMRSIQQTGENSISSLKVDSRSGQGRRHLCLKCNFILYFKVFLCSTSNSLSTFARIVIRKSTRQTNLTFRRHLKQKDGWQGEYRRWERQLRMERFWEGSEHEACLPWSPAMLLSLMGPLSRLAGCNLNSLLIQLSGGLMVVKLLSTWLVCSVEVD